MSLLQYDKGDFRFRESELPIHILQVIQDH